MILSQKDNVPLCLNSVLTSSDAAIDFNLTEIYLVVLLSVSKFSSSLGLSFVSSVFPFVTLL